MRSNSPDTYFLYICTVTLTIWPLVKVMTHLWTIHGQQLCEILSRSNMALSYLPRHRFSVFVHSDLDISNMTLGQSYDTPFGHDNKWVKYKWVKYYPDPTWQRWVLARTRIFGICALWPWRYDLESRSWHTLVSWITIVWNIIQIQLGSWPQWTEWDTTRCPCNWKVCHDLNPRSYLQGQGHSAHIPKIRVRAVILTAKLDLDSVSHICCPWPKGVSWPWPKVISPGSRSQCIHTKNRCPGNNSSKILTSEWNQKWQHFFPHASRS